LSLHAQRLPPGATLALDMALRADCHLFTSTVTTPVCSGGQAVFYTIGG